MAKLSFPDNIDLDCLHFFIEELKDRRDGGARFFIGQEDGDDAKALFAETDNDYTCFDLGNPESSVEDLLRLHNWLTSLPEDCVDGSEDS